MKNCCGFLSMALLLAMELSSTLAADDVLATAPLPADQRTELTRSFEKSLAEATKSIEADPKNINAYSRRGDAHFFLGKFDEAVADYDQMVKLDDSQAASHWRRGIAYFYAGKFKEAAAQFESYHSFDQVDRENGIWRYLSQFQAHGRDKAREGLLKYEKDDREPFPSVYKLFAGSMKSDEILKSIDEAKISADEREKRLFYAHLYVGLNHAVEGDAVAAQRHLRLSTLNKWGPTAGYGPNYMWHVGRLHEELLRTKPTKKTSTEK
jgi:lipoprotein NlpI